MCNRAQQCRQFGVESIFPHSDESDLYKVWSTKELELRIPWSMVNDVIKSGGNLNTIIKNKKIITISCGFHIIIYHCLKGQSTPKCQILSLFTHGVLNLYDFPLWNTKKIEKSILVCACVYVCLKVIVVQSCFYFDCTDKNGRKMTILWVNYTFNNFRAHSYFCALLCTSEQRVMFLCTMFGCTNQGWNEH